MQELECNAAMGERLTRILRRNGPYRPWKNRERSPGLRRRLGRPPVRDAMRDAMALSCSRSAGSSATSGVFQSIALPSAIRAATPTSLSSLTGLTGGSTFHLMRQPNERPRDRHARGIGGGFSKVDGQFVVGIAQLDSADDGFTLVVVQAG